MSDLKSNLLKKHVEHIRNFNNQNDIRHEISRDIAKLKSAIVDVIWHAMVNDDPIYKTILQEIENDLNNPEKGYYYIDTRLQNKLRLDLYADADELAIIKNSKLLCEQLFSIKKEIQLHDTNKKSIESLARQELRNGKEELTKDDLENQKQSNQYREKKLEIEFKIKLNQMQVDALRELRKQYSDKKKEKDIIDQNIIDLKSNIRKLSNELDRFLIDLALSNNPNKIYISYDVFEAYRDTYPQFIEFKRVKNDLENKEQLLVQQIQTFNEEFDAHLRVADYPISTIKDKELKLKLAKEASKLHESPFMPFYELREYINDHSFVILPNNLINEVKSFNIKNNYDQQDYISTEEQNQFFEDCEYEIECGIFGKVKIGANSKNGQKFLQYEFLNKSVIIVDYDKGYDSAIVHFNGSNYRLNLQLVKYTYSNEIKLALHLDNEKNILDNYHFKICSKNTIPKPLFGEFSSTILK